MKYEEVDNVEFLKRKWGYLIAVILAAAVLAVGAYLLFWNQPEMYMDGLLVKVWYDSYGGYRV